MRISDWSSDVCSSDLRSFEHSAKLQGGAFVEFTISSGFCLNTFSMIDAELAGANEDYLLDCMAMLTAIVSKLARHIDRHNDTDGSEERGGGKVGGGTGRSRWAPVNKNTKISNIDPC